MMELWIFRFIKRSDVKVTFSTVNLSSKEDRKVSDSTSIKSSEEVNEPFVSLSLVSLFFHNHQTQKLVNGDPGSALLYSLSLSFHLNDGMREEKGERKGDGERKEGVRR